MNCETIQKKIYDYSKGDVPDKTRQIIKSHLSGCAACTKEYEKVLKMHSLFAHDITSPPKRILNNIRVHTGRGFLSSLLSPKPVFAGALAVITAFTFMFIGYQITGSQDEALAKFISDSYNITSSETSSEEIDYAFLTQIF